MARAGGTATALPAPGPEPAVEAGTDRAAVVRPALPAHAVLLVMTLVAAVTRQGAYYDDGQRLVLGLMVVTVLMAWTAARPVASELRSGLVVALGVLAGWAVVSASLAGDAALARSTVLLLAGMAAVLAVCRRLDLRQRDALASAVLVAGALCALSGWAGVAWRISPLALEDQGLWRAATSLTYANATAGLLVPLVLLGLARLARTPRDVPAAVVACVLLIGAGATLSRAGLAALLAGTAVLAWLLGARRLGRAAAPPVVGALVALAALAPSMPAAGPARPALAVTGLVAGLGAVRLVSAVLARIGGPAGPALLAAVAVAGVAGMVVVAAGPVWDALADIAGPRLTVRSSDRRLETAAALRSVAERPLTGTGPGRLTLAWEGPEGSIMVARWAHNEYLQALAELGAIGLAALGSVVIAVAAAVRRGRSTSPSPEVWAGVAAGLVALALHSGFDFLWHVPAIPLLAALFVGLTTPSLVEGAP